MSCKLPLRQQNRESSTGYAAPRHRITRIEISAYGAVLRAAGFAGPPLADRISGFSGINAADFLK